VRVYHLSDYDMMITMFNMPGSLLAWSTNWPALMILKAVSMSWLTVIRMMQVKGGFRSPEDLRKTPFNPEPNPEAARTHRIC
jgi:hypothetical protein